MSFRPTPECDQYAISIPTSTGKTYRVILYETAQGFEAQRDELQEKYDKLVTENMLEVNEICNQRDAAMDALEDISFYLSSGLGDENTTVQEYKDRILDGIKHLTGHAWEERCKYEKLWKEAEAEKINSIKELKEAWLAMDEIEGTDRINEWQNKNANIFNTEK
jgi:hypothetical protein